MRTFFYYANGIVVFSKGFAFGSLMLGISTCGIQIGTVVVHLPVTDVIAVLGNSFS